MEEIDFKLIGRTLRRPMMPSDLPLVIPAARLLVDVESCRRRRFLINGGVRKALCLADSAVDDR